MDIEEYKCFAVVAPMLPGSNSLVFEVRADSLSNQPGEICFPGGFIEANETPEEAGVRELAEELLTPPGAVEMIAPLDILLTHYGMAIYPYLGYLHNYQHTFNADEVKETFTVPIDFFMNNEPRVYYNTLSVTPSDDFPHLLIGGNNYHWRGGAAPVLFYLYQDKVIWGLTARIIKNIVGLIKQ